MSVATWERFETRGSLQGPSANPGDPSQVLLIGELVLDAPDFVGDVEERLDAEPAS